MRLLCLFIPALLGPALLFEGAGAQAPPAPSQSPPPPQAQTLAKNPGAVTI